MIKTVLTMLAVTSTLVLGGMVRANADATLTYDFTTTFPAFFNPPFSTWDGSFTITFDPTAVGLHGPSALDAFSSNLPASYSPFVYFQSDNIVEIGDNCSSIGCLAETRTNTALIVFEVDASGTPTMPTFILNSTNPMTGEGVGPNSFTLTLAPTTPLPAALPLFASGLGGLGLLGWCQAPSGTAPFAS
jgi:hypothetical protein